MFYCTDSTVLEWVPGCIRGLRGHLLGAMRCVAAPARLFECYNHTPKDLFIASCFLAAIDARVDTAGWTNILVSVAPPATTTAVPGGPRQSTVSAARHATFPDRRWKIERVCLNRFNSTCEKRLKKRPGPEFSSRSLRASWPLVGALAAATAWTTPRSPTPCKVAVGREKGSEKANEGLREKGQ